jgi:hypothetical protein
MKILNYLKYVIVSLLVILLLWFVWEFVFLTSTYNYIYDTLVNSLNLNIWLVRAIAIITTVFTLTIVIPNIKTLFNPFASKIRRNKSLYILGGISVAYCIIMFGFTANYKKDMCYATDYKGDYILCNCNQKIHPEYLTDVKPITREIAIYIERRENKILQTEPFQPDYKYKFFASDGTPLVWYIKNDDSSFDFCEIPGVHPNGQKLMPVTVEIVKEYFNYLKQHNIKPLENGTQEKFFEQLDKFNKSK